MKKTKQVQDGTGMTQRQGVPLRDTGEGNTGVPADEQGISNRPRDQAQDSDPVGDEGDEDFDDEEDGDVDGDDDDDDDAEGDEEDEVTDPKAEPGKPI